MRKAFGVTMQQAVEAVLAVLYPGQHVLVVYPEREDYEGPKVILADAVRAFLKEYVAFPDGVEESCPYPFLVLPLSGAEEAARLAKGLSWLTFNGARVEVYSCCVLIGSYLWHSRAQKVQHAPADCPACGTGQDDETAECAECGTVTPDIAFNGAEVPWREGMSPEMHEDWLRRTAKPAAIYCDCGQGFYNTISGFSALRRHQKACPRALAEAARE